MPENYQKIDSKKLWIFKGTLIFRHCEPPPGGAAIHFIFSKNFQHAMDIRGHPGLRLEVFLLALTASVTPGGPSLQCLIDDCIYN